MSTNNSRRELLWNGAAGFAGMALLEMLTRAGAFAASSEPKSPLAARARIFRRKPSGASFCS